MTDKEVEDSFNVLWLQFWKRYKDNPPKDDGSDAWQTFCDESAELIIRYPLMEQIINRMTSEIIERARGRGHILGDFHRPPT